MFRTLGRSLLVLVGLLVVTGAGLAALFSFLDRLPKTSGVPVATSSSPVAPVGVERPDVARLITRDLKRSFGGKNGTYWHGAIKKIEVDEDMVTVKTNLVKNPIFRESARDVCSGVSSWVFARAHQKYGLRVVVVRDQDDWIFVHRSGLEDSCAPF